MGKKLVIVESPAKAKTIGRYLGDKYRIAASVGHIRDLPSNIMGVDVKNEFKPRYIPVKGKNKVIKELKTYAQKSDGVLIATDPDREGEAIGWHIAELLKIDTKSKCRIAFNEITKSAVSNAVKEPRVIDMNLVNAQQARRILDRLVGYELSPLLWKKVKKGLSAGRVQSVATKMIVDREEEIDAFVPEEYWNLTANLSKKGKKEVFKAKYHGVLKNNKISVNKVTDKEEKDKIFSEIKGEKFVVHSVKKGKKKKRPYAPFTTSTLQQEASKLLGFTSKRTMRTAQQLYEGITLGDMGQTALVTYIRTDSVRSSSEAVKEIRNKIEDKFGPEYISKSPRMFKNKNKSQDGHEAIRPAHFDIEPNSIKDILNYDQYRLYNLIWNRFMASQMADASLDTVVADIKVLEHIFRTKGEIVKFPGFLTLYERNNSNDKKDSEMNILPEMKVDEELDCKKLESEQKFTLPPARYTEASLIKALEEKGIGRPSTYAPTISTILDRRYVEMESKQLIPTELGKLVTQLLKNNFKDIVDIKFTAKMEQSLDKVEEGAMDWVELLSEFYPEFHKQVMKAGEEIEKVKIEEKEIGEKCPECKGPLVEKDGRYGKFIACKKYPDCKYTRNIEEKVNAKCPICGSGVLAKYTKRKRKFFVCDKKGKDPECPFISWDLPAEGKFCETCNNYMVIKKARGKTYTKCGNRDCPTNAKRKQKQKE